MPDIWILLLAVVLLLLFAVPVVQQQMTRARRLRAIREIEAERRTRVIALIHRQERIAFLGIPFYRYIDINDSEEVLRAIRLTSPEMPIDFIIHTPGGLVLSSEQIAMALQRHKGKVTIFVPHYAMSGGTLLCLAADEVMMDENAVLGPVDPRIGDYPAASILRVPRLKPPEEIEDETFILVDIAAKAQNQMREFVVGLLRNRMEPDRAERLGRLLTEGTWTHDYPITFEQARDLGLPVTPGVPAAIYRLMDLFPQAMVRRPSVAYVPIPYREEKKR
ncbi:ATP-dependent Clp protease proteolytic subunit [Methanoculleus sp.]|uniref:SDH family Clp fold serine proteinase n=1 Tax=Methanoculleus sp. TaxID=90427 RepID=UPI0025FB3D4E|nr:ATP-dependent Clp protease proteolytic subunit [Methanoculleus sp.]